MATTMDAATLLARASETKVPVVHAVCIAFMVHTVIVVGLRLYSRIAVVKAIGSDDSKLFPENVSRAFQTDSLQF